MPLDPIFAFFQQASAKGSRSTVLGPLAWLAGICVAGFLVCVKLRAGMWSGVLFAALIILVVLVYLGSFLYCLRHDRDSLRSERYSISKLAIEKGFVGDSTTGIFKIDKPLENTNLLETETGKTTAEEEHQ